MQNIEFEKMTDRQALSWLMQPGIKALLYGRDKNTNGALLCAVRALQNKIALEQSLIKEPKKVYGVEDIYFWTFTDDGTKVESGCFDWCCMQAEITNYQEQKDISEEDAYKEFWNNVRNYNIVEFDSIVADYDDLEEAIEDGALDELRLDYVGLLYEFVGED